MVQRSNVHPDHNRITKLNHLADNITELVAHLDAGTFQLLKLISEFDNNEGWSGPGIQSCAHWLNWKCGMSLGPARERVRVARAGGTARHRQSCCAAHTTVWCTRPVMGFSLRRAKVLFSVCRMERSSRRRQKCVPAGTFLRSRLIIIKTV